MSATVRLAVETDDVDHPDLLDPLGDEVHLGADEIRVLERLLPGHEEDLGGISPDELLVEFALHITTELHGDAVELEIHAGLARGHVPPGDLGPEVPEDDTGQCVQCGVGSHREVPATPVDDSLDRLARVGQDRPGLD